MTAAERLSHMVSVISSRRFLTMEGLNNEVPFFIYPYEAENALQEKIAYEKLLKQLDERSVKVLNIDLYDLAIEVLREREILDPLIGAEPDMDKEELKEVLQGVLDPQTHLVPAIRDLIARTEHDVLFITGVGEVFPYVRSHNVLNNLQSVAKNRPTVMFFPGAYTHALATGASLDLFGRLHDDKYYRAFNILYVEGA